MVCWLKYISWNNSEDILEVLNFFGSFLLSMEEMKQDIIDDLIDTESLALMNDDAAILNEMIAANDSIDSIANIVEQTIESSEMLTKNNFDFFEEDSRIKEFVFNPNSDLGSLEIIELDDSLIIVSLKEIQESTLNSFENIEIQSSRLIKVSCGMASEIR